MFRCPQPSIVKNNYYFQNNAKGKQLLWRHYQLTYFFHTPHIDVVLPLLIGGMSFYLMGQMNEMTSDIATSWLPSIDTARELNTTLSHVRMNELKYLEL